MKKNNHIKKFINYSIYSSHSMKITTIQLSNEMKEKLATFGSKNETYDTILRRIYALAVKEQLRDFLMSSEGFISIDEARKRLDKEWPRSK